MRLLKTNHTFYNFLIAILLVKIIHNSALENEDYLLSPIDNKKNFQSYLCTQCKSTCFKYNHPQNQPNSSEHLKKKSLFWVKKDNTGFRQRGNTLINKNQYLTGEMRNTQKVLNAVRNDSDYWYWLKILQESLENYNFYEVQLNHFGVESKRHQFGFLQNKKHENAKNASNFKDAKMKKKQKIFSKQAIVEKINKRSTRVRMKKKKISKKKQKILNKNKIISNTKDKTLSENKIKPNIFNKIHQKLIEASRKRVQSNFPTEYLQFIQRMIQKSNNNFFLSSKLHGTLKITVNMLFQKHKAEYDYLVSHLDSISIVNQQYQIITNSQELHEIPLLLIDYLKLKIPGLYEYFGHIRLKKSVKKSTKHEKNKRLHYPITWELLNPNGSISKTVKFDKFEGEFVIILEFLLKNLHRLKIEKRSIGFVDWENHWVPLQRSKFTKILFLSYQQGFKKSTRRQSKVNFIRRSNSIGQRSRKSTTAQNLERFMDYMNTGSKPSGSSLESKIQRNIDRIRLNLARAHGHKRGAQRKVGKKHLVVHGHEDKEMFDDMVLGDDDLDFGGTFGSLDDF